MGSDEVETGRRGLDPLWPALPLAEWRDSYATLHMCLQIVGKTRLAFSPSENHWWHIALYVTERGLTTSPMPLGERVFSVDLDFLDHNLSVRTSAGDIAGLALYPRSVADFYAEYTGVLASLGIPLRIHPVPVEVEVAVPFAEDQRHAAYDPAAVERWWRVLLQGDRVLKRFRGRFLGKSSPVHFFWGSFDLASTRFSGRRAPLHPGGAPNTPDRVMHEAYSHECWSAGFWPGGGALDEPAFYAYAYPEPEGFAAAPLAPAGARYDTTLREHVLPYELVRTASDPDATLLEFLQSSYSAAADLGHWDRQALDRPPEEWPGPEKV